MAAFSQVLNVLHSQGLDEAGTGLHLERAIVRQSQGEGRATLVPGSLPLDPLIQGHHAWGDAAESLGPSLPAIDRHNGIELLQNKRQ
jgi:hypothetical protein